MLSLPYEFLCTYPPHKRRLLLGFMYLLFVFAFAIPPILLLALIFLLLGTAGMMMAQRKNEVMLFSMPSSSEIVQILKERHAKYHAFVVLSYTVFLPCAACFFIGYTYFVASHTVFMGFFVLAFVWMYWRYFDLYDKLNAAS